MSERSAREVHEALKAALARLQRAEECAVLQFAEILRRRLYLELGHASIQSYAAAELGFGEAKVAQFMRLAMAMERLPALKRSVEREELPWTKALAVARVATPSTEGQWLKQAKQSSNRELEASVRRARAGPALPDLFAATAPSPPPAIRQAAFSLDAAQFERLEALTESLRKRGHREPRGELLLAAFEALTAGKCSREQITSPYEIVLYRCQRCGQTHLPSGAPAPAALVGQAECDGRLLPPGERSRAAIPPARRRAVLVRDGHRCRMPGCAGTRFLEVHHLISRAQGGDNSLGNLVTLCSRCHRALHEQPALQALLRRKD